MYITITTCTVHVHTCTCIRNVQWSQTFVIFLYFCCFVSDLTETIDLNAILLAPPFSSCIIMRSSYAAIQSLLDKAAWKRILNKDTEKYISYNIITRLIQNNVVSVINDVHYYYYNYKPSYPPDSE